MSGALEVAFLNLADEPSAPETFSDAIEIVATRRAQQNRSGEQGMVRPWNFVVVDTRHGLEENIEFYRSFFWSVNVPRMILLLDDSDLKEPERLVMPALFEEQHQRLRLVLMSSLTGCSWDVRSVQPDGICSWSEEGTARANLQALVDALCIPEVYDQAFVTTSGMSAGVWSIGGKQAWFGSIESKALADAFRDVGSELLGDDARVAILKRLSSWLDEVGPQLLGREFEDDILEDNGDASGWFEEVFESCKSSEKAFGLRSWRRGMLHRVAAYPGSQIRSLVNLEKAMCACDDGVSSLLRTEINANDGFQRSELARLRAIGIQLNRADNTRSDRYRGSDIKVLEVALEEMDKALAQGYSLATVRAELEHLTQVVAPRTKDEIENGKKLTGDGGGTNDDRVGLSEVSLLGLSLQIHKAAESTTKKPLVYIGKIAAQMFSNTAVRVLGSLFYFWIAAVFVFETLGLAKGVPSLVPVPESAREVARHVMTVVLLAVSFAAIVMGICIVLAAKSIQRWGVSAGVPRVEPARKKLEKFFKKMALNEWVLWAFRNSASRYLKALDKSIENLSHVLRETLIEGEVVSVVDGGQVRPNPQIRKYGGELASAAWFRQMDDIKAMLKTEVIERVRHEYRIGTPEFRTDRCEQVAESLAQDLREPILRYIKRLQENGVLHIVAGMSEDEKERRVKLAERYWGDFAELRDSLREVIEVETLDPLVQFISSEDIMRIDQAADRATLLRFAPEPSRRLISDSKRKVDVVYTQSTELAGAIRFVPFRFDQFSYSKLESEKNWT